MNFFNNLSHQKTAYFFIFLSTLFRLFLAGSLEFGNDEVYYWLYALQPDISHFDHPPMVGYFIQFFTADLFLDSELWIRLAAIIPGSLTMLLVYKIGVELDNEYTGLLGVLLYQISPYGLLISGTLILPDAPLLLFWMAAFYCFLKSLPFQPDGKNTVYLLFGFVCTGLAIYSKYQAVYLLFGAVAYVVFLNRSWLRIRQFYFGFIVPILVVLLIFSWNYENNFSSFSFHGARVAFWGLNFNWSSFLQEVVGQIAYNNPYIIVLVLFAIFNLKKLTTPLELKKKYMFLFFSLPLIATVIYLSLYKSTLPHWSGVAYCTLLPLVAMFLSVRKKIAKQFYYGIAVFWMLVLVLVGCINCGWFSVDIENVSKKTLGNKDLTLDMYGWQQASEKLAVFLQENTQLKALPIVINKWYPGSHIHYYLAKPNNREVYALGSLTDIHKYYWWNEKLGRKPKAALYITDSRNYTDPNKIYDRDYAKIQLLQILPIERNGQLVKNVFVFRLQE
ncbi:ArnT family glycosyltransferase [Flavicella sediminum]|uniref:ArnT family glycosyltransferase n=1 Tax=Flavicella sediminum TaxID=2585141 RepID=UPI00111E3348|nr:glycosyltransferase family 39 protein [Flavicella sediminum]